MSITKLNDSLLDGIYVFLSQDIDNCIQFGQTCRRFYIIVKSNLFFQGLANYIQKNYNLISSMHNSVHLWQFLKFKTPVILLGEHHGSGPHRKLNARVVNSLKDHPRDFYTERSLKAGKGQLMHIDRTMCDRVESWDLQIDTSDLFTNMLKCIDLSQMYLRLDFPCSDRDFNHLASLLVGYFKSYYPNKNLDILDTLIVKGDEVINKKETMIDAEPQALLRAIYSKIKAQIFYLIFSNIAEEISAWEHDVIQGFTNSWKLRNQKLFKQVQSSVTNNRPPIVIGGSNHFVDAKVIDKMRSNHIHFLSCIPKYMPSKQKIVTNILKKVSGDSEKKGSVSKSYRQQLRMIEQEKITGADYHYFVELLPGFKDEELLRLIIWLKQAELDCERAKNAVLQQSSLEKSSCDGD